MNEYSQFSLSYSSSLTFKSQGFFNISENFDACADEMGTIIKERKMPMYPPYANI